MENLRGQFFISFGQTYGSCHLFIKDKVVNLGHGDGMQVPSTLFVRGSSNFTEILQRQLLEVDIQLMISNSN